MVNNFTKHLIRMRGSLYKQAAANTLLIAFFYIFMEWVFFVTKPSFMNALNLGEKVKILLITGFAGSLFALLSLPVILILDLVLSPVFPSFRKFGYHLPASFVAASLCLILVDNFTYTVFKFGIVNTSTWMRALYGLAFLAIWIMILRKMTARVSQPKTQPSSKLHTRGALALFSISLVMTGFTFNPNNSAAAQVASNPKIENRPNIILLSTDGLSAANMSVYGYERDTTPFLKELATSSLLSQNNFTNAGASMGSETALLTGKSPLATRVLYPPDTLKGMDKYQHLPGLLKNYGYRTVSLGVKYFVDANTVYFQNAFDAVNCVENPVNTPTSRLSGYGYDDEIYLLTTIEGRITERLKHIFFIEKMQDPYALVTQAVSDNISDKQRLNCLRAYLDASFQNGQPLFAHVHLMGTHGSTFSPSARVFSKDEPESGEWMTDFYDDAILDFDREIQQLVDFLKEHNQYDNTLLVVYTDHGQKWVTTDKVPLIIHFPHDQYAVVLMYLMLAFGRS